MTTLEEKEKSAGRVFPVQRPVGQGWHRDANRVCLGCANSGRAQVGPANDGYSHIWCKSTDGFARYARAAGGECGQLAKLFVQRPEQQPLLLPNAALSGGPQARPLELPVGQDGGK